MLRYLYCRSVSSRRACSKDVHGKEREAKVKEILEGARASQPAESSSTFHFVATQDRPFEPFKSPLIDATKPTRSSRGPLHSHARCFCITPPKKGRQNSINLRTVASISPKEMESRFSSTPNSSPEMRTP